MPNNFPQTKLLHYLFSFVSLIGAIGILYVQTEFRMSKIRNFDIESKAYILSAILLLLHYGSFLYYFNLLPWHGKLMPILIFLFGCWYLFISPFGALDKLPPDQREISAYNQAIFLQSLMLSSFILSFYIYRCKAQNSSSG